MYNGHRLPSARRTFIDKDHFSFQASLTRQFTLSGLFEKVDFIKEALKDLIEVTVRRRSLTR